LFKEGVFVFVEIGGFDVFDLEGGFINGNSSSRPIGVSRGLELRSIPASLATFLI
jgi:hypothetical protein